ncbi:MAG: NAD(P)/FAD-dependent oxidoreductase [Desulfobacteraceae bacterium]|nr:NAD(P)/FAD-dependent oxidoreductase [Desulfobacteraceae bacterium]MBC2756533.1 NAD(P)/FAD-dependent oxidoreductase [Desulfobacteraceae bacterium]
MKKVVVIGSGVGGSAIAALLAKQGAEVHVFERNNFLGGKAASYVRDGFTCDMGIHYTARGDNGPLGIVAKKVSADLQFITEDPFLHLIWDNKSCKLPLKFTGLVPLAKMALTTGVKIKNYWVAFKILNKLLSANTLEDVEPYNDVPLKDFLYQYTDDPELHTLIAIFCGLLIAIPIEEASTGEFMWCFSTWAKTASCAYPRGGFGEICNSYIKTLKKNNGIVRIDEGVKDIKVTNNRVSGVETNKGFYPADIVISNAGIKRTIELAGENQFDEPFVNQTTALRDSLAAVTIKYALDYKPVDIPITLYCDKGFDLKEFIDEISQGKIPKSNPPLFIPCPSVIDNTLAPFGKHILLAGTAVPLSYKNNEQLKEIIDRVDKKVMELFPGIDDHIIFKHTTDVSYIKKMSGRHAGDAIGLAQSYDQVWKNRPGHQTSIEGLYLVGSDAGGNGIGTEMAADSALKLDELITQKYDFK